MGLHSSVYSASSFSHRVSIEWLLNRIILIPQKCYKNGVKFALSGLKRKMGWLNCSVCGEFVFK